MKSKTGETILCDLLVHEVKEETIRRLRELAEKNGRTVEHEVLEILESATDRTAEMARARESAREFRESLGDRVFSDSTELIREDRDSR